MMLVRESEFYIAGGLVGAAFFCITADVTDGCTFTANRHTPVPACLAHCAGVCSPSSFARLWCRMLGIVLLKRRMGMQQYLQQCCCMWPVSDYY